MCLSHSRTFSSRQKALLDSTVLGLIMCWLPKKKHKLYNHPHTCLILSSKKWWTCVLRNTIGKGCLVPYMFWSAYILFHLILPTALWCTNAILQIGHRSSKMELGHSHKANKQESQNLSSDLLDSIYHFSPAAHTNKKRDESWSYSYAVSGVTKETMMKLQGESSTWIEHMLMIANFFWTHETQIMYVWLLKLSLNWWCYPIIFQHWSWK